MYTADKDGAYNESFVHQNCGVFFHLALIPYSLCPPGNSGSNATNTQKGTLRSKDTVIEFGPEKCPVYLRFL